MLVYPDHAVVEYAVPFIWFNYLRDESRKNVQILKNCSSLRWQWPRPRKAGFDWSHWTRDASLLESVLFEGGDQIASSGCAS